MVFWILAITQSREARRAHLKDEYFFECSCARCQTRGGGQTASDDGTALPVAPATTPTPPAAPLSSEALGVMDALSTMHDKAEAADTVADGLALYEAAVALALKSNVLGLRPVDGKSASETSAPRDVTKQDGLLWRSLHGVLIHAVELRQYRKVAQSAARLHCIMRATIADAYAPTPAPATDETGGGRSASGSASASVSGSASGSSSAGAYLGVVEVGLLLNLAKALAEEGKFEPRGYAAVSAVIDCLRPFDVPTEGLETWRLDEPDAVTDEELGSVHAVVWAFEDGDSDDESDG